MASPREFKPSGSAGMQFSDYIPHIATCADDLCMIRSMHTEISNHHPAQMMMNCGTNLVGRPAMGSWVTYGLGSESESLPGFVVLTSTSGKGIEGGSSNWSSGFLPSKYQGVDKKGGSAEKADADLPGLGMAGVIGRQGRA